MNAIWNKHQLLFITALLLLLLVGARFFHRPRRPAHETWNLGRFSFALWLAQGFGVGMIPFAPGTFGSLLGVLWFALLLSTANLWIFAGATFAGVALSVWLCGVAEKTLRQTDPGSVVLDEIAALPVCFFAWVGMLIWRTGVMPGLDAFFSRRNWPLTLGVFAAFRFFDIVKPWPVRQSQSLPGGWGVTIDDLLAAAYVNGLVLLVCAASALLGRG